MHKCSNGACASDPHRGHMWRASARVHQLDAFVKRVQEPAEAIVAGLRSIRDFGYLLRERFDYRRWSTSRA